MNVDRLLYILRTITTMHVDIRFNAYISIDSILLYVYVIMSLLSINNNYNYLRSSKKNALSELAFFYPCFMFNKYKMTTVLIACSSNATYNYCLLVFLVRINSWKLWEKNCFSDFFRYFPYHIFLDFFLLR